MSRAVWPWLAVQVFLSCRCLQWPLSTTVSLVSILELTSSCLHAKPRWPFPERAGPHAHDPKCWSASLIQGLFWRGVWLIKALGMWSSPSSPHVALGAEPMRAGVKAQLPHPCPGLRSQLDCFCGLTLSWPLVLVVEGDLVP